MTKEECVNGLKHMAAYKSLSLQHIDRYGLKDAHKNPSYVVVERSQLEVLKTAIFHLTGEVFEEPVLTPKPGNIVSQE